MTNDLDAWRGIARRWERRTKHYRGTLVRTRERIDAIADRLDALATRRKPSPRDLERIRDQLDALADSIDDAIDRMNTPPRTER